MSEYFKLLMEKKPEAAEEVRKSGIPTKLIKFFSLNDDTELNEKKFQALQEEKLWFSSVAELNDPYEYKCMYVDGDRLSECGYPKEFSDAFQKMLDENEQNLALVSMSGNDFDEISMWAYYTNNHAGYCVEYTVLCPDTIYEVSYEPKRIPIARLLVELYAGIHKMTETGKIDCTEWQFCMSLLRQQFFLKHESWKNEKEYRIVYPLQTERGSSVPISEVGLKTSRIVAGLNCKQEHVERLNSIAAHLGCGKVSKLTISKSPDYAYMEDL